VVAVVVLGILVEEVVLEDIELQLRWWWKFSLTGGTVYYSHSWRWWCWFYINSGGSVAGTNGSDSSISGTGLTTITSAGGGGGSGGLVVVSMQV
jgi:hypothetical protein